MLLYGWISLAIEMQPDRKEGKAKKHMQGVLTSFKVAKYIATQAKSEKYICFVANTRG
jgi:hypothetical protein